MEKLENLYKSPFDLILLIDLNGNFIDVNTLALNLLGYNKNEIASLSIFDLISNEENEFFNTFINEIEEQGNKKTIELKLKKKDGCYLHVELEKTILRLDGKTSGWQIIARDLSNEKRLLSLCEKSEQKFIDLAEDSSNMIFINAKNRLVYSNKTCESFIGYSKNELLSSDFDLYNAISPEHRDTFKTMCQNVLQDINQPQQEIVLLHKNNNRVNVLLKAIPIMYNNQPAVYCISTSITQITSSKDYQLQSAAKLIKAITSIIDVIASTMQLRDPYTSEHQIRVTKLACAISREMGLSESTIEGIRLAAIVHDIGKIYLPAEVLSKPPPLNDFEWNMVKMHPRAGYDILRKIDFPWPIPEVALEHHERLDGSGYPRRLTSENTLFESKIVAVADVVEAMSTHRPYRSSFGIDRALVYVTDNKGILFDIKVVETCLRLFYDKGFSFEEFP